MTSPRTEVRIRMRKLFDGFTSDGVSHEPDITIPEICIRIRMALNGASDPWRDDFIKDTYQLLQDVLTTWEPSVHDDLSAKMDDAVKDLVMATLSYVAANVPDLAEEHIPLQYIVLANLLVSRPNKIGALLKHVKETGHSPWGLNEGTRQAWEAMLSVGLVKYPTRGTTNLTDAGKELLKLTEKGDY